MIRIGVMSDTHHDLSNVQAARRMLARLDWFLHAGDHYQDAAKIAQELGVEQFKVRAVVGNCDHPVQLPTQAIVEIGGVKIWIVHGHQYSVKVGLGGLHHKAKELGAKIVVFGHTHVANSTVEEGILLFNPGSLTEPRPRGELPSCGLLEIDNGFVTARIVRLYG